VIYSVHFLIYTKNIIGPKRKQAEKFAGITLAWPWLGKENRMTLSQSIGETAAPDLLGSLNINPNKGGDGFG
jgi:hypothetical protein